MTETMEAIKLALTKLDPTIFELQDDSFLHVGHAGNNSGGGHYSLVIVSEIFQGKSLIKRHQLVYDAVNMLMKSAIHALRIEAKTPEEYHHSD